MIPFLSISQSSILFCLVLFVYSCGNSDHSAHSDDHPIIDNQPLLQELPFQDSTDFQNATKGFIATLQDPQIKNKEGAVIMDLSWFDFLKADAPKTVNPSLWRQGQLNRIHGLFEVTPGIYQIRGFDLANMTVVASDNGWIVIDPLTTSEVASVAMDLINKELGVKPIKTIIITHSHIDHFGGIEGIISQEDLDAGRVELIAPEGFYENSISENILAGNAMSRRAMYMFGTLLPMDTLGFVGSGLGQSVSLGSSGILKPTITITEPHQTITIDGLDIVFQNTPEAEAPAECMFYFPKYKAFCQAEEINHTLHNLYTLRGAQVRNGLKWSKYIDQSIQNFGDEVEISFGSHHWPTWGNENILDFWSRQRDLYKYIHDQTLQLANNGYTGIEIAEMIQLPSALSTYFANRGYYGTLSHNAKAQYQLYYGWYDANPAHLHSLPTTEASKKYVDYMGGPDEIIRKAKEDIEKGNYRWAAMVLNHVVFADPDHQEAREQLAYTYDQLAYRAESGPWRNFYLTGAQELRSGIVRKHIKGTPTRDNITANMSLENLYDYLAIRLDRDMAEGKSYSFNIILPDTKESISIYLSNQVLHNRPGVLSENPDASITMNRSTLTSILLGKSSTADELQSRNIKIDGNTEAYIDFLKMVEKPFNPLFNIVDP